jgi:hypothetical protein
MGSDPELPRIQIRTFPSGDADFARATHSALDRSVPDATDVRSLASVVDRRLREAYPNSRIVPQDEMGRLGKGEQLWYVYRDGRVRPPDERRERLYRVVGEARRTVAAAETTLDHSRAIAREAGFDGAPPPLPDAPLSSRRPPAPRPRSAPRRGQARDEG